MGFISTSGLARFWAGVKARFVAVEGRVGSLEGAIQGDLSEFLAAAILEADKRKHPIGTLLSNLTGQNPATYMGFGTWEAWGTGRVPVGVDAGDADFNTAEKTGGAKSTGHTHAYTFDSSGGGTSGSTTPGAGGSTTPGNTGSTTPGATGPTTLTAAQMPSHYHPFTRYGSSGTGIATTVSQFGAPGGYQDQSHISVGTAGIDAIANFRLQMNAVGGSEGHTHPSAAHTHTSAAHTHTGAAHTHTTPTHTHTGSNSNTTVSALQPYITCYMWKRTAQGGTQMVTMIKVFVLVDALGGVRALESALESPGAGWTQIDEGDADDPRYGEAHLHYTEEPLLHPAMMVPRYRLEDGSIRARTDAELNEAVAALPEPATTPEQQAMRMLVVHGVFSDAEVSSIASVLRPWRTGLTYAQGEYLNYDGQAYQVQQAHTAQAHQPPGSEGMLAIYRPVQAAVEDGQVLPWVSGEAVAQGDLRSYEGVVYECISAGGAGANVWTPDTVPAIWKAVE